MGRNAREREELDAAAEGAADVAVDGERTRKKKKRDASSPPLGVASDPVQVQEEEDPVPRRKKKKKQDLDEEEEADPVPRRKNRNKRGLDDVADDSSVDGDDGAAAAAASKAGEKKQQKKERRLDAVADDSSDDDAEQKTPRSAPPKDAAQSAQRPSPPVVDAEIAWTSSSKEHKVCVGGLPWNCTEGTLKRDFDECGEVTAIKLLMDKHGAKMRSRGVAFITFATQAGLAAALKYDGDTYGGRTIKVSRAEERSDKGKGKGTDGKGKGKPVRAPGQKPEHCTSILVKSLPGGVSEEDVYAFFQSCGSGGATNVRIVYQTAIAKSLAFVDFDDTDAVDQAIKLHGTDLKGWAAHLDFSKPRAHKIW